MPDNFETPTTEKDNGGKTRGVRGNKKFPKKRGKFQETKSTQQCKVGQPGNDFSWWSKDPELIKDAANYKSNYIAGTPIAPGSINYIIPGVLKVELLPVFGNSSAAVDPLNLWARDLYLRMFQKYRGISSYTAADLGITLLAGVEIVKLIAQYERIYGIINRYSRLNINMPYAEVLGCGITTAQADYLRTHLSDFRYDLNMLIRKAQRFCVLKDMSVVADAISLFGYEYKDHESERAQIILFTQHIYGVYSDTNVSSGGSIDYADFSTDVFDFNADNMCKALSLAVDALVGSDSVQKIFGDLLVWFGEEAMLQFVPVPDDYIQMPVYSESILHKLHNLETLFSSGTNPLIYNGVFTTMSSADKTFLEDGNYHIYQMNDNIVSAPFQSDPSTGTITWSVVGAFDAPHTGSGSQISITKEHIVDTYRLEADPEVVTEGVLFKWHQSQIGGAGFTTYRVDTCAFYIARRVGLISMTTGGAPVMVPFYTSATVNSSAQATGGALAVIDWAPLSLYINSGNIDAAYGDLDNVIPMYFSGLSRLHRTIVLSGLKTGVVVIPSAK